MDALKAEIATKRKAIQDDAQGPSKYLRRGDLERLKAEEEQKAREVAEERTTPGSQVSACVSPLPLQPTSFQWSKQVISSRASTNSPLPDSVLESMTSNPESSYNLSNEETIRRLRVKGQPIRLFGESDRERRLRLRALELIEERDQERQGGQNDFKKALEDVENAEKLMNKNVDEPSSTGKRKDESENSVDILDLDLLKTDPQKAYPIIYYALKRRLKEWEAWMDERPGAFSYSLLVHRQLTLVRRTRKTVYSRQARIRHSAPVGRESQTLLQNDTPTSEFSHARPPTTAHPILVNAR